jgi:DnaJ-class molecular chaperone
MKDVEFILNQESNKKCITCDGTGHVDYQFQCGDCEGTGIYKGDNHYIMVVTDEKGNKIAFDVDQGGK